MSSRRFLVLGIFALLLAAGAPQPSQAWNACPDAGSGCYTVSANILSTSGEETSTISVGYFLEPYWWMGTDGVLGVGNGYTLHYWGGTRLQLRIKVKTSGVEVNDCSTEGEPGTNPVSEITYGGYPTYYCGDSSTGAALQVLQSPDPFQ